jgi:hypothetical protein
MKPPASSTNACPALCSRVILAERGAASKRFYVMSVGTVVVLAAFSALWIYGLIGQLHSEISIMRYLVLSLALVAAGVYRFTRRKKR